MDNICYIELEIQELEGRHAVREFQLSYVGVSTYYLRVF